MLSQQKQQSPLKLSNQVSTVESILSRLEQARKKSGRPSDFYAMNYLQLTEEKISIKKELKIYDLSFLREFGRMVRLHVM